MKHALALAALLLAVPGCTRPAPPSPAQMSEAELAGATIRLTRSICFGTCPIYAVEIRGDGSVVYEGQDHVLVQGTHRYKVDPAVVRALIERFRAARFWSLKDSYEGQVTDNPTQTLTVTLGGKRKSVSDYVGEMAGMPPVVTELEKAVDIAADTARWVTGNDQTLSTLRAEGWNFQSPEAGAVLERAALRAPDAVVFGLIDGGASPDGDGPPGTGQEGYAETPLENAAMMARLAVVRRLIAAGASTKGPWIQATLRGAVVSGDPPTVAAILKYKPDVNAPVSRDYTALQWIEAGPHPRWDAPGLDEAGVARLLVEAGARRPAK